MRCSPDHRSGSAPSPDPEEFKRFEAQSWSERADSYDRLIRHVTEAAAPALLDASGVAAGMRVLDLGCGRGHTSAAIAERGAQPLGVDIAEGMLEAARELHPGLEFAQGDAEHLAFGDASFDAVAGGFTVNHLPVPERGAAEAARVVRPGGRVAFSVWDTPERTPLIGMLGDAVERAGLARDEAVPDGPDGLRFADGDEFASLLSRAGLVDVRVESLELTCEVAGADELWDGLVGGTVRSSSAVLALGSDERQQVRECFDELAAEYGVPGGGLRVPAVVRIASGRRL
ncbi:MAG: methyltransferase domain-containing protein [Actinomycetota bacterium]